MLAVHGARPGQPSCDSAGDARHEVSDTHDIETDRPRRADRRRGYGGIGTDEGEVIAMAVVGTLRGAAILLPSPSTIERAGLAERVRARKGSYEALLAGLDPRQIA